MRFVVLAMIKNEHAYLDEWLTFHLNKGFEHIYLVEDLKSESHKNITSKYEDKVSIHKCKEDMGIDVEGIGRQMCIYDQFFQTYMKPEEETWCAFLDIDEFFDFDSRLSLQSIVKLWREFHKVEGIYLFLRNHFADGKVFEPAYVHGSYKKVFIDYNQSLGLRNKTFCRVDLPYHFMFIQRAICSFYDGVEGLSNCGDCLPNMVWIDHYFTKSWEGWLRRMRRGTQVTEENRDYRHLEDFFKYNQDMCYLKDYLISSYKEKEKEWLSGGTQFLPSTYKEDFEKLGYKIN